MTQTVPSAETARRQESFVLFFCVPWQLLQVAEQPSSRPEREMRLNLAIGGFFSLLYFMLKTLPALIKVQNMRSKVAQS